jgi:hypothetical protein
VPTALQSYRQLISDRLMMWSADERLALAPLLAKAAPD